MADDWLRKLAEQLAAAPASKEVPPMEIWLVPLPVAGEPVVLRDDGMPEGATYWGSTVEGFPVTEDYFFFPSRTETATAPEVETPDRARKVAPGAIVQAPDPYAPSSGRRMSSEVEVDADGRFLVRGYRRPDPEDDAVTEFNRGRR
jgi:hypothetical protein